MGRYVDLDKLPLVAINVDTINGTAFVDLREVQQALWQAEAETGEVAEVKHAHWVSISRYSVKCSACGGVLGKQCMYADPYCGRCGAKIDWEWEDEDNG